MWDFFYWPLFWFTVVWNWSYVVLSVKQNQLFKHQRCGKTDKGTSDTYSRQQWIVNSEHAREGLGVDSDITFNFITTSECICFVWFYVILCVCVCVLSYPCVSSAVPAPGGNGKQKLALWQVFIFQTFLCAPSSTVSAALRSCSPY